MKSTTFGRGQQEKMKCVGKIQIFRASDMKLLYEKKNLVVNTGLTLIRDMFDGGSPPDYCAVGDDTTPVTATDTTLGNEIFRKQKTDTDTPAFNVWRCDTQFNPGEANFNWKEIGLFRDVSAGPMFNRVIIDFNKVIGDTVIARFEITFTAI